MPLRAILFDKDGTLVDFHATWGAATYAVMRRMSAGDEGKLQRLVEANHYDVATLRMRPTSPLIAQSSADYGVTWAAILGEAPEEAFFNRMDALFIEEGLAAAVAIGEASALLSELSRDGYLLGIVTNDSEAGARAQSEKLGFTPHLKAIFGYDSGHGRKPDPDPILAFGRAHGLAPAEIAMVGDSTHDLDAARAAGALAIAVLSGPAGEAELSPHADHVLPDISALPALLRQLEA